MSQLNQYGSIFIQQRCLQCHSFFIFMLQSCLSAQQFFVLLLQTSLERKSVNIFAHPASRERQSVLVFILQRSVYCQFVLVLTQLTPQSYQYYATNIENDVHYQLPSSDQKEIEVSFSFQHSSMLRNIKVTSFRCFIIGERRVSI